MGSVEGFSRVYPVVNEFMIPSTVQNISLSVNIEGKWTLPDNSNSTNSILTIPNLSSQDIGVYKFYIKNWDGVEVCAFQIDIGIVGMFAGKVLFVIFQSVYSRNRFFLTPGFSNYRFILTNFLLHKLYNSLL